MTDDGSSLPPDASIMVLGGIIAMMTIVSPLIVVAPTLLELSLPVTATEQIHSNEIK